MDKIFTLDELQELLGMTRQGLYYHRSKGLKVSINPDRHISRVAGNTLVGVAFNDLVAYFGKCYREGRPKALYYLTLLDKVKRDSKI